VTSVCREKDSEHEQEIERINSLHRVTYRLIQGRVILGDTDEDSTRNCHQQDGNRHPRFHYC
jgi:hypothetical protein